MAAEVLNMEDGYLIHLQSEHSLRRASMTLGELFQRAKELGAKKLILTEYETLSSCIEAYDLMEEYHIPVSIGTEIRVQWKTAQGMVMGTILLIPTDQKGYGVIGKILSENFRREENEAAVIGAETLRKWLAPGTCGHTHVMITTGGTDGILFQLLKSIPETEEELETIRRQKRKLIMQDSPKDAKVREEILRKSVDDNSTVREKQNYRRAVRESAVAQKREKELRELEGKERNLAFFLRRRDKIFRQAADICDRIAEIVGEENFFVELFFHNRAIEKSVIPSVAQAAGNHQLLLAEEARYAGNSRGERRRQELIEGAQEKKETGFAGDYSMRPPSTIAGLLGKFLPEELLRRCEEGRKLCGKKSGVFSMQREIHYPVFPEEEGNARLRRLIKEKKEERYPGGVNWSDAHERRLKEETNVIIQMGFSDYFCIVEDLVSFIHRLEAETPGGAYYTGPGRGSAAGSLVSYILGITAVDSVEEELLFSRFLNPMRITAPDIDIDIAPGIYDKVIQYIKDKYGEHAFCAISTKMRMGALQALEYAGTEHHASVQMIQTMKNLLETDHPSLRESPKLKALAEKNKKAASILSDAVLLEGRRSGMGQHPSGLVLSDTSDISNRAPLVMNERTKQWMTQFDMEGIERIGLLKLDLLKLRTLDVITDTLQHIEKPLELAQLPFLPEVFRKIFGKGETVGVFQLESVGMRKLLKEFQPSDIRELTLLISIYRPGPIQYAEDMVQAKRQRKRKLYQSEKLNKILEDSYGYPVYQEEIMRIFHEIGGLSLEEADIVRRAIAKKDAELLEKYRFRLIEGLVEDGVEQKAAFKIWQEILEFGKFSFNRSHAAAYARLAYITAYLKCYYPREFLCALFNHSDKDRFSVLAAECKRNGIEVLPPDICRSEKEFVMEGARGIRFGLMGIKGMNAAAVEKIKRAKEEHELVSMKDFLQRSFTDQRSTDRLIQAGAMDRWTSDRKALMEWYPKLCQYLRELNREKELRGMTDRAKILQNRFLTSIQDLSALSFEKDRIEEEEKVLGCRLSGQRFGEYKGIGERLPGMKNIAELSQEPELFYGKICVLKILRRKKDGKEFAVFMVSDGETEAEAVCSADTYAQCGHILQEGSACVFRGRKEKTGWDFWEQGKIIVQEIRKIRQVYPALTISVPMVTECKRLLTALKRCQVSEGISVFLKDRLTGEAYKVPFFVSEQVYRLPWDQDFFLFQKGQEKKKKRRDFLERAA